MVVNRQRRVPVRTGELEKFIARARRALHLPAGAVTICFVTDSEIARWNGAYRGKNRPTDVLSFPTDEDERRKHRRKTKGRPRRGLLSAASRSSAATGTSGPPYLGDIAIAPRIALRNSQRLGRTLDDELRILILHGMLHLMGYDHETDSGQMDRRELRLRRALGLA
jgi:probable rRNA maturation factor